jgi:hypothetical protein
VEDVQKIKAWLLEKDHIPGKGGDTYLHNTHSNPT